MQDRIFAEVLARVPYAAYLGLSYDAVSGHFELPFRNDLVGNTALPAVHGGAVGALLEMSAMIWLSMAQAQPRLPKPVDFSVDFLRSAGPYSTYARCEVLRQGRRLSQVQVQCWQHDQTRLVATGRGHFLLE